MTLSDEANTSANPSPPVNWTVTGSQSVPGGAQQARVDVVVRGTIAGTVDRGNGADRFRFSAWDDGQEKDFRVVDIPLGRTGTVTVRLGFEGRYLTVADGIGITVTAGSDPGGERVFELDPFHPAKA